VESALTDRFRKAIGAQDYRAASQLWNDYAGELRNEMGRGILSAGRMMEARELFEWGHGALLCARAQSLDRLNTLHAAAVYAAQASHSKVPPGRASDHVS
jgi:hypothetical protein